jgi:adenylate kinase
MIIVLLGIQGSGKSTQGNLLSKILKLPYLSTGHIFREIAKERTTLGRHIKELLSAGSLVPDDLTMRIVKRYLKRPEYASGFIIDGFPRTLTQAKLWKAKITKVVYLDIDQKEALWRLVMRDQPRDDTSVRAVQHRIELFYKHTAPVVDYYEKRDLLVKVNAQMKESAVCDEILKSLGTHLVANHLEKWKQKKKKIIIITGLSGSGKSEATSYLVKKYQLPSVSFSKFVNDEVDRRGLEHVEDVHKRIRVEFREKYGMAAMAQLGAPELKKKLEHHPIVIVESLYSWEEYLYLKKHFADALIYIIAIYADKHLRYERTMKRTYRKGLSSEERDINQLLTTNLGPTIAFADFVVNNNFTVAEFYDKLDNVYHTILYT